MIFFLILINQVMDNKDNDKDNNKDNNKNNFYKIIVKNTIKRKNFCNKNSHNNHKSHKQKFF